MHVGLIEFQLGHLPEVLEEPCHFALRVVVHLGGEGNGRRFAIGEGDFFEAGGADAVERGAAVVHGDTDVVERLDEELGEGWLGDAYAVALHLAQAVDSEHQYGFAIGEGRDAENVVERVWREAGDTVADALGLWFPVGGAWVGWCLWACGGSGAGLFEGGVGFLREMSDEEVRLETLALGAAHAFAVAGPEHGLAIGHEEGIAIAVAALGEIHGWCFAAGIGEGDVDVAGDGADGGEDEASVGRPGELVVAVHVAVNVAGREWLGGRIFFAIPCFDAIAIFQVGDPFSVRRVGGEKQVHLAYDAFIFVEFSGGGETRTTLREANFVNFRSAIALAAIQQTTAIGAEADVLFKGRRGSETAGMSVCGGDDENFAARDDGKLRAVGAGGDFGSEAEGVGGEGAGDQG